MKYLSTAFVPRGVAQEINRDLRSFFASRTPSLEPPQLGEDGNAQYAHLSSHPLMQAYAGELMDIVARCTSHGVRKEDDAEATA